MAAGRILMSEASKRLLALHLCLAPLAWSCGDVPPTVFEIEETVVQTPAGSHTMVTVPEGIFVMGAEDGLDDERPVHQVFVDAFLIDKYEVTNQNYMAYTEATGAPTPVYAFSDAYNDPSQPVVGIVWSEASDYCEWAGMRLPTEAEWEKAARGTESLAYPWGNDLPSRTRARYFSEDGPVAVGSLPDGQSPYGAFDMSGNVWEYVRDHYVEDYYSLSPDRNPVAIVGDGEPDHTIRGGSWASTPDEVRATRRWRDWLIEADQPDSQIGFRCARD
jgi:formylglycine-generating enzyme required for sulfatase activity